MLISIQLDNYVFLLECLFAKTVKITRNNILENRLLNHETSIAHGQH